MTTSVTRKPTRRLTPEEIAEYRRTGIRKSALTKAAKASQADKVIRRFSWETPSDEQ